jgi:hypothetical protein
VRILLGAPADEVGPLLTAIVHDLVSRAAGDIAGLPGKFLQVILRQVARLDRMRAKVACEPAGLTVIQAIEPGHGTLLGF